jgi:hypothetical protein
MTNSTPLSYLRQSLDGLVLILILSSNLVSLSSGTYLNGSDIVVGIVSTGEFSGSSLDEDWGPTFSTYLTETVGRFMTPPRNFSMYLMTIPMTFKMVEEKAIDFIFTTPSVFSCLESENAGIFIDNCSFFVGNLKIPKIFSCQLKNDVDHYLTFPLHVVSFRRCYTTRQSW